MMNNTFSYNNEPIHSNNILYNNYYNSPNNMNYINPSYINLNPIYLNSNYNSSLNQIHDDSISNMNQININTEKVYAPLQTENKSSNTCKQCNKYACGQHSNALFICNICLNKE